MARQLNEQFLRAEYGRRWKFFGGDAFSCASLLDWTDINRVLSAHWHESNIVRLIDKGRPILLSEYVEPRRWRGRLDLSAIQEVIRCGAAVVIEDIASWEPALLDLILQFESVLRESVETQLFVSGPFTTGFGLHWDPYDVFAIQILGERTWKIYHPTRDSPLLIDREVAEEPNLELVDQVQLQEGDALYLPRGWWHDAGAAASPSAHLTIVVPKRTGVDFLSWLGDEITIDSVARTDIPRFGGPQVLEGYADKLRDLITQYITPGRIQQFLASRDVRADPSVSFSLPWTLGQQLSDVKGMVVTNLVPRAELAHNGSETQIQAGGMSYVFDTSARAAISTIFEATSVQASELLGSCGLSQDSLMRLLDELRNCGLISVV